MTETYYTILGLNQDATDEEIKSKYQQLIKLYHPDKNNSNSSEEFIKIKDAWLVLRDEKTRKEYDSNLLQNELHENSLIYVELNECEINFVNDTYKHPCRCGQYFIIDKEFHLFKSEMGEDYLMECIECSNCISIKCN